MRVICFCNSTLAWGGGEKWHFETACALARRGWRVYLLCHPEGALYRRAASEGSFTLLPLAIGRLSFLNPFVHVKLTNLFRRLAPHAVIMNLPSDLKCVATAAKKAEVPHIVYRRGSALPVKNSLLNRHLFGTVITRLITNSEATKRMVLAENRQIIPESRITVIPNGVDIPAFYAALRSASPLWQPPEPTVAPAETPALPDASAQRPLVIGNAGRLNRQKGQHMLILAGAQLARQGIPFHMLIAGEGERLEELQALVSAAGIEERVTFTGFMKDLSPFWKSLDVFVLTSLWEGFGFVAAEAMLARKPVLAFGVSNLPEMIENGKNGYLFALPKNAEPAHLLMDDTPVASDRTVHTPALGQTPQRLSPEAEELMLELTPLCESLARLAESEDERWRLGAEGRQRVETRYGLEKALDRLEAILQ